MVTAVNAAETVGRVARAEWRAAKVARAVNAAAEVATAAAVDEATGEAAAWWAARTVGAVVRLGGEAGVMAAAAHGAG